jgi:hypothetical protein
LLTSVQATTQEAASRKELSELKEKLAEEQSTLKKLLTDYEFQTSQFSTEQSKLEYERKQIQLEVLFVE